MACVSKLPRLVCILFGEKIGDVQLAEWYTFIYLSILPSNRCFRRFTAVYSGKQLYTAVGRVFNAVYGQTSQCQVFGAGNLTKTSQNNVAKYDILLACLHSRKAGRLHKLPKRIILLLCSERLFFLKLLLSRISRILPFHATTTNDNLWEE